MARSIGSTARKDLSSDGSKLAIPAEKTTRIGPLTQYYG
jgi:hypothetical protein